MTRYDKRNDWIDRETFHRRMWQTMRKHRALRHGKRGNGMRCRNPLRQPLLSDRELEARADFIIRQRLTLPRPTVVILSMDPAPRDDKTVFSVRVNGVYL